MILVGVFQVHRCNENCTCQCLDGRLLEEISLTDVLYVANNQNKSEHLCDNYMRDYIEISDDTDFQIVNLKSIYAYGEYWENLSGGMSARIECISSKLITESDIIYKVISSYSEHFK